MGQFPASAATSLIEGYCDDFVSFASTLAQTLEQVSMRGLGFDTCRESLMRMERGMRDLAGAIQELLERGTTEFNTLLAKQGEQNGATGTPTARPPSASSRNPASKSGAGGKRPAPLGPRPSTPAATTATMPPAAPKPPVERRATQVERRTHSGPTTPGAAHGASAREPLRGTSQSMPLLSVFQFLGRMRKTGVMRVTVGNETMTFEMVNGCVQLAVSDNSPKDEHLGELLIEQGMCTRQAITPLLASASSSNEKLGNLVVQQKLVSNGQILEALELQVQRRFARACKNLNASYQFDECAPRPTDGRIRITPLELSYGHKNA
ncbi:MAG TPA: DUF4388 domain-containing protein [Planctomycetota bacterium]|nr:DUF4388 domain-containing protein [Planctomycetota bacterium]